MGIYQRYVLAEMLRVFAVLLVAVTVLLVLVGVVNHATQNGLGPIQVIEILPYIIPSMMPFTIPATALLTACVVFGRLAGDQEITAIKAAGINVIAVLWPAFFVGGALSVCTLLLTDQFVPWANGQIERAVMFAMEDIFLDVLRSKNAFIDMERGLAITVIGVDGKKLVKPTFRYTPSGGNTVTIQAAEASMKWDMQKKLVLVHLYNGHIETPGSHPLWFANELYEFPLPRKIEAAHARNIPLEIISRELDTMQRQEKSLEEQQVVASILALNRVDFDSLMGSNQKVYEYHKKHRLGRSTRLQTEYHSRLAMSCSCFFFILLGAPFSIAQGRRQFLTNFFICFLPVLVVYYPVHLLMTSLAKDRQIDPVWGMWIANAVLGLLGLAVLRKVLKY
jgi:lipopolysaccharide export system permease protein